MAKFQSAKYPGITLQDEKGIWAQFVGGEFETSDTAVLKRLRALAGDGGLAEVKESGRADGTKE